MAKKVKNDHKKIIHKKHTGKLRPHKHTSYGSLAIIVALAFVPLLLVSRPVFASDGNRTYAVVPGAVPKTPAVITAPSSGKVVTTSDPITVTGKCTSDNLIKIFKNEIMAGATLCQRGIFSLPIDLFAGNNTLIARTYNALDEPGPDSVPVTVSHVNPGTSLQGTGQINSITAPTNQFFITTEVSHRGANVGDPMTWPLTLTGGQAPYAVSVSWGDGKTELISRGAAGRFDISHTYKKAASYSGSYIIIIKATDQVGSDSYLQLSAIVSGDSKPAGIASALGGGSTGSPSIKLAWVGLGSAVVIVASFWIGERREAFVLSHKKTRTA